jgi:cytochrome c551
MSIRGSSSYTLSATGAEPVGDPEGDIVSDTTKASSARSRSSHHTASLRRIGLTLIVTLLATAMLLAGTSGDDAPDEAQAISATQTATCVQATNIVHAQQGRAISFLLWSFARGSYDYLGWIWATTSLREGPTGTWTMVANCGGSSTTSSSTTSTTRPSTTSSSTTSTTRPSTTTSSSTTTMPPPNGAAIYAANCAGCHGADGSGGVGPDLRGTVDAHGVEATTEVITNCRGAMPAWEGRLTPAQIAAVVDFLATLEGGGGHDHHGHHGGHHGAH